MGSRLLDFILNFLNQLMPVFFIREYNKAVFFRCGKFKKILLPGLHWKIPFIDEYEERTVVITTMTIPSQSLTTKDNKQVVVKSVVKYSIKDIKPFMLDVYDATDAISDVTQAIIKEQIVLRNWDECSDNELDNIITKKLRVEVRRWGIDVEKVTLTDIGQIRSIRLFNENIKNT